MCPLDVTEPTQWKWDGPSQLRNIITGGEPVAQPGWFIDSVAGNDRNTGLQGSPLRTYLELSQRFYRSGTFFVPTTIDIFQTNDTIPDDTFYLRPLLVGPNAIIRVIGTPTILDSGVITAKTDLNAGTTTPPTITDAGQDFSPYLTRRLRITTPGPRFNAIAWVNKILAATQVRTSAWGINNTFAVPFGESVSLVNPQVNDAYVIEQLPILGSVALDVSKVTRNAQSFDAVLFADLRLGRPTPLNDRLYFNNNANIALSGCDIFARNIYGRSVTLTNCLQQPSVYHLGVLTYYAGMGNGNIRPLNPCQINVSQHYCGSPGGGPLFADAGSAMFVSDAMLFDMNNAGISVSTDSTLHIITPGLVWGNNNVNYGLLINGRAHYDAASKPTVTGLTADVHVGGTNFAYAAVPVSPQPLNGAMLCVTPT